MSIIGSNILAGASGQGGAYNLTNSLRFRASASAYLNRTPASAGNRKTWTWSAWVKLGTIDASNGTLFSAGTGSGESSRFYLRYVSSIFQTGYGSENTDQTVAVFRDPSAWYHVVLSVDTTQATANNRIKIYVNGVQQTIASGVRFSQNTDTAVNNTVTHSIARDHIIPGGYYDGYLTEVYLIDGQALTPSSFGETSATTGVWQPIEYAGTYGTNGFYLPFTDNSALTTSSNVGLGKDFSGNGNYWTTNNISITSGSTYDSMTDVPTLTSATASNYCVLNPLDKDSSITISSANLNFAGTSSGLSGARATFGLSSGKWYFECTSTLTSTGATNLSLGFKTADVSLTVVVGNANLWLFDTYNGVLYNTGSTSYGTAGLTSGDVFMVAADFDVGRIWFGKNGTWFASGNPATNSNPSFTGVSGTLFPNITSYGVQTGAYNFGQRPFAYTPPTGFVALNTFNLPTPTIGATASTQAGKYMSNVLWTGNGASTIDVTGVGFQPDFVWAKRRSAADGHGLFDVVRGTNQWLQSNTTGAETTFGGNFGLLAFNSDGFQMGSGSAVNLSGATYVGWNWKANGTGVTNTAGSITSTVSANTSSGFSVVTYTGNGTNNATVGHGLGVAPKMVIVKQRNGTYEWAVYHSSLTSGNMLFLNLAQEEFTIASRANGGVSATSSTTFTCTQGSSTLGNVNASSQTYVAYCFSEVAGYSKAFSYTGNGSADGGFIFCGFRPRWVMVKNSSGTGDWIVWDSARNTFNVTNSKLSPNTSGAEFTDTAAVGIDLVSNGFKIRGTDNAINASSATFIGFAVAENPFKYSTAR
jgi:hypothetical protein